ncbi:hypothetical protein D3C71_2181350 [compost metagenome]
MQRQTVKNFPFGFRHASQRAKAFQMGRREVIHQRRFWSGQFGGVSDFALMISPEFDHRILVLFRQAQQR